MTDHVQINNAINNIVNNRIKAILKDLCQKNNTLVYSELAKVYCSTPKKSNAKRVVKVGDQCMAKKADGLQCTRRRKTKDKEGNLIESPTEYCGKHLKARKFGRVDDELRFKDTTKYLKTSRQNIDGEYYLVDEHSRVFTYNKEHPILLGKKINDKLILIKDLIKAHNLNKIRLKINVKCGSSELPVPLDSPPVAIVSAV
tara:strand:+ start:345 stop:944 length:600 start_codon:yes stop_codon:yes gene_type:complete